MLPNAFIIVFVPSHFQRRNGRHQTVDKAFRNGAQEDWNGVALQRVGKVVFTEMNPFFFVELSHNLKVVVGIDR